MALTEKVISQACKDAAREMIDLCEADAVAAAPSGHPRNQIAALTSAFAAGLVIDEVFSRLISEDRGNGYAETVLGMAAGIAARSSVLAPMPRAVLLGQIARTMIDTWSQIDMKESGNGPA